MLMRACVIFLALTLAACGGNTLTKPVAEQAIPRPAPGKAQIVFLRPSGYFPGLLTYLYEVNGDNDTLISPIGGSNKVVYDVAPGQRLFMSNMPVMSHFMKADLAAGKRYYVLVRPVHGYGFQMRPLRKDGTTDYNTATAEFPAWLKDTVRVEPAEDAQPFLTRYKSSFDKSRAEGWAEFQGKSASQLSELTLTLADGFDP